MEKLFAIFISLVIFGQAWLVRLHLRNWINPSSLYGLFWFLYALIPLLLLPSAEISLSALFYILITCIAFSSSSFILDARKFTSKGIANGTDPYRSKFLIDCFYIYFILCVSFGLANWYEQGIRLSALADIVTVAQEYMEKRYSGNIIPNVFLMLFNSFVYPVAAIGGLLFGADSNNQKLRYVIMSFIPAILVTLIEANKGTFFLVLAYFWGGVLITKFKSCDRSLISSKSLKKVIYYSPVVLILLVVSFISRGIDTDESIDVITDRLLYYFRSYSSGHLYAFSDWFSYYTNDTHLQTYMDITESRGFYTFMSVFKVFGSELTVPDGVFDEYYNVEDVFQTNIYTYYRGLILDYGLFGSVLMVLCFGFFLNSMYFYALRNESVLYDSIFILFVGFAYTSFIVSIFIWNSPFVFFVILYLTLKINKYLYTKTCGSII